MKLVKTYKIKIGGIRRLSTENYSNEKGWYVEETNPTFISSRPDGIAGYGTEGILSEVFESIESRRLNNIDGLSTMYRYPRLSLSRDKVSLYCDKKNMKVTRKKDDADFRILSLKTIDKMLFHSWSDTDMLPKKDYLDILKDCSVAYKSGQYEDICNIINNQIPDDSFICINRHRYYSDPSSWTNTISVLHDELRDRKLESRITAAHKVKIEDVDLYNEIVNGSFTWALDSDCNKIMSSTSVALDDKSFIQIKEMFKSNSTDDQAIAMTLMANCELEASKTYLAMLFFHFGERMKGSKTWNTVGFKSLRNSFQKYYDSTYWDHGSAGRYDKLIQMLIDDDALTTNAMEHVLDMVFDRVIQDATGLSRSEAFIIKRSSISLTPEFAAKVKDKTLSKAIAHDGLPF